ncbi:MAG: hypothetical protein JO101_04745, partial [Candidatus Eremiobacteraeota bacterium]|nr:hypothetical protein [Candidatus Eremiobacteraeota bacterium]
MSSRLRIVALVAAGLAVLVVLGIFARNALLARTLETTVRLATGYGLAIGRAQFGSHHATLFDVHVSRGPDPVLDARRVDLDYALRDLFPGGERRYGFVGVAIRSPHLWLVRHKDGSFNVVGPGGQSNVPAQTRGAVKPYFFTARISDGTLDLIDRAPYDPSAQRVTFAHLNGEASVKTTERTRYRLDGALLDNGVSYPWSIRATIDVPRGYAIHHIRARAFPIRALTNYLMHTDEVRVTRGTLHRLDASFYTLALTAAVDKPVVYHLSGSAALDAVALRARILTKPVEDLRGRLDFADDLVATDRLYGRIGSTQFQAAGGIFDFANARFRLAVNARDDLHALAGHFSFSQGQPLGGNATVSALVEGLIDNPLIYVKLRARAMHYQAIPIDAFAGTIGINNDVILVGDAKASLGARSARISGRFVTSGRDLDSLLAFDGSGPGGTVPYLDRLAPLAGTELVATLRGTGGQFDASGLVHAAGGGASVDGTFAIARNGVGTFGPISIVQPTGRVDGTFFLDRPHGTSAVWATARGLRLGPGLAGAMIPGVDLPAEPPLEGRFDARLAGIEEHQRMFVAGNAYVGDLAIGGVSFENARVELTTAWDPSGAAMVFAAPAVTLRAPSSAQIGIPLHAVRAALAVLPGGETLAAAEAQVAGGHVAASGPTTDLALAASGLEASSLRALGVPLWGGTIAGSGALRVVAGVPAFDGVVALDGGKVDRYRVDGGAQIGFGARWLRIAHAVGALGDAWGDAPALAFADGSVDSPAATPRYALNGHLRGGEIAALARSFDLPIPALRASVDGDGRIEGSGARPRVTGSVSIPEGSVNGLDFTNARADIALDPLGVSASNGQVNVGSTRADFAALAGEHEVEFSLDAPRANLADFNNFFDAADTFAGAGALRARFAQRGGVTSSGGAFDVANLRFRRFSIGDARATWTSRSGTIVGTFGVKGPGGTLDAGGTITVPRNAPLRQLATRAELNLGGNLQGVDLGVWLPALGYTVPLLGHVDASGHLRGRYPNLAIDADADLVDGVIGRLPVDRFHVVAAANGKRTQISSADLELAGLRAALTGSFGFGPSQPLALSMQLHSDHIGDFFDRLFDAGYDADAELDAHLAL